MTTVHRAASSAPSSTSCIPVHFASRHIGPRGPTWPRCSRAGLSDSSTRFIDAVVPGGIRLRRPLALPPGRSEREVLQALRGLAGHEPGVPLLHRHGLRRLLHAPGDPAQRAGEPRLVHRVHPVPGGDRPGPAGGAAQLPDRGVRPHRPGGRQRLAAGRGDRRGGGDGPDAWRSRARSDAGLPGGRALSSADHRGGPDPGRGARRPGGGGATRDVHLRARRHRRAGAVPRHRRRGPRLPRACVERAHAAGALVTAATDLLAPDAARARRASGARTSRSATRSASACRMGYGGPHAAFFATRDAYKRLHAGTHHRRLPRPGRASGAADGAADPGAAHPAGQGDQQRLHRPGAPRGDGEHVRGVPRPRRPPPASPSGCTPATALLANALRRLRYRVVHEDFFDTLCVEVPEWALPRLLDAARARHINLRPLPPTGSASRSTRRSPWAIWPTSSPSSR